MGETMHAPNRIIVVGASAGGVESLKDVLCELPADFPMAICVVLHVPAYQPSNLPQILTRCGRLPAVHPEDGAKLKAGHIYVAPPDHHLLVDGDRLAIKKGPKENRFRPSIDALFRSVAYHYGPRAIGIVLSGALDDGTSGLWSIKRLGGVAIVQEPSDARFESMPKSALEYVEPDYQLPAREIGALLPRLLEPQPASAPPADKNLRTQMELEIAIAVEDDAFRKGVFDGPELTPFTCPECHGVLVKIVEDRFVRFRCHTGHAYTDSALLEGVMETTGAMLWQVMRSLEEAVMLLNQMGQMRQVVGDAERAQVFFTKAAELEKRSDTFHKTVLSHESLSGDNLGRVTKRGS
jgi:two-component system, chemotaxis family, protein-glutamate methylesterase/glutaminase